MVGRFNRGPPRVVPRVLTIGGAVAGFFAGNDDVGWDRVPLVAEMRGFRGPAEDVTGAPLPIVLPARFVPRLNTVE